ncbi:MAG: hypothetical protein A2Z60_04375 [Nitrospirae bacterium RIFCSPLOWO2_02_42_7]|nr:MAG: hypothetical protein A2Z60_04375 [Nitrospirae bacterium RIFCSPLOWO2_02_42_7]
MVIIRFIHLLSLIIWIGGMIFLVTIGAPSIFKILPREAAGDVLGDIFPKYWIMGYLCSGTALVTILLLSVKEKVYPWGRIGLLVFMTVLTLYLGLVVAARAREVRVQIRSIEDTSQKEVLKTKFKGLHKWSVFLNVIILVSGLVVIFLIANGDSKHFL